MSYRKRSTTKNDQVHEALTQQLKVLRNQVRVIVECIMKKVQSAEEATVVALDELEERRVYNSLTDGALALDAHYRALTLAEENCLQPPDYMGRHQVQSHHPRVLP
mmetsp:Transcript_5404/g.17510  ORF Transcript_5404/g.17510 Transcript_5404/m.17510 type:complete len:106 (+) Transcript_5404:1067-1384(+)